MIDEQVSPELALVDPELARRLRAAHLPPASTLDRPPRQAVVPRVAEPAAPSVSEPAPSLSLPAASVSAPAPAGRRWRLRVPEAILAVGLVWLLAAAFLPVRDAPTFAATPQAGRVLLAWPEMHRGDSYLLRIQHGRQTVYERRLDEPHLDEVLQLVDGQRYTWRAFLASKTASAPTKLVAHGSFVLGE